MANPRKFSEKIALHNQKQAEETAAFERIMQEVSVTRVIGMQPPRSAVHLTPHPQAYPRPYLGGSLPNVNQIAANPQMELHHQTGFDESKHPMRHPARFDSRMRPYGYVHRRAVELTNRNRMGHFDGPPGQYSGHYLSPPSESSWRSSFALSRTNSDSALHQSVMNPNPQDPFNPQNNQMHHQVRRDENNFNNMPPSYKAMLESKKFDQNLANRPKSCEAPNISLLPSGGEPPSVLRTGPDGSPLSVSSNGTLPPGIPVSVSPSLSHVAQIGNNTGSLPDLTNLHIPPPLSNPIIDYDESQTPSRQQPGQNTSLYNRSAGNIPTASAISHLGGLPRGPASPNRSRRHTHNGPSPLSLSSPEHARRMKYPNVTSPNVAGGKSELKSPSLGGTYSYPYPPPPPGPQAGGWSDHPGSPSHGAQRGIPNQGPGVHPHHMSSQHHTAGSHPLHVDVSAASKIQQSPFCRGGQGASMTSPLTSPTSPTSQCSQPNFSPVTSPHHEFTTGGNPILSESYYTHEAQSLQPLQHQFEQIRFANEDVSSHRSSGAPPMYSTLAALAEHSNDECNEVMHGNTGTIPHIMHGIHNMQGKHGHFPNNLSRIPDIVFTGADDPHMSKGSTDINILGHDLGAEYFPGDELKANLGLEELQMLEDSNIITDPDMEDSLRLDSL
ncbi:CREB-regulated transcription coactivator 1-like isoform X3 [Clavelina lepadiformis]|uniref:CREB-regulated transcription coactivator 1-like isoform X3 n=1 Tax=Clavelina lepadiformis TaxID=159417 RepID=UPI0040411E79